ncbi:hypothetical protein [Streptacidiphilus carbonis]|uniref:hypothetical protein n=1 Tax=Streptacidiphilus carbonis TaxID=105422 RepID=UPI0005AAF38E|nr:hypothetical protein [Streptacidiphilus carbonis]
MFPYLRLARGYGFLDLCRCLLTAAASATVGALLLSALGRALSSPEDTGAAISRLLWCLPALAAVGYLCAAWARSLPAQRPERVAGLVAAGAGPVRTRLVLAGEIALICALGAVLALFGFVVLREHWLELTPDGQLDPTLGAGANLPAAGTVALLAVVPLLGGLAAGAAVRSVDLLPGDAADQVLRRPPVLYSVAVALLALAGAAVAVLGLRRGAGAEAWTGAALGALGLAGAVPTLLYLIGGALATGRPRAVRLLAGRALQADSWRLGAPLAVLAVAGAMVVTALLRGASGQRPKGPLLLVEVGLLGVCVLGALLARLVELARTRRGTYASLSRIGAPGALLLRAAAVRCGGAVLVAAATAAGAAALTSAALAA